MEIVVGHALPILRHQPNSRTLAGFPLCTFVSFVVNAVGFLGELGILGGECSCLSPQSVFSVSLCLCGEWVWTCYHVLMRYMLRFLWNATRGHHLTPWRSPYLLWRIETYTGVKMHQIGLLEFWEFTWRERKQLWRFLKWTGEMERYAHPKARLSS
jgi:hypothetical protein